MRTLHLEKKGLRGLAIAESFSQNSIKSVLAGVIMRRDFIIDGFVFGKSTIFGDDSTDEILKMFHKLSRPDISFLLISGVIISMYNFIDVKRLSDELQIPVIAVTYDDSSGIDDAIKHHFPKTFEKKLEKYKKLADREKITLKTSYDIFVRREGCTLLDAKLLLNTLTLQGDFPEPLRVAQLLARTKLLND